MDEETRLVFSRDPDLRRMVENIDQAIAEGVELDPREVAGHRA